MLISLTAAALVLSVLDTDQVLSTASPEAPPLPQPNQAQFEASLAGTSPSTTVQSATPHGLSTAEQIAQWIGQNRSGSAQAADQPWPDPQDGPVMHKPTGELSLGLGTGGYRDYSARVTMPVGETGTLHLGIRHSRNSPFAYGYPYGPYGVAHQLSDPHAVWRSRGHADPFERRSLRSREVWRASDADRVNEDLDARP